VKSLAIGMSVAIGATLLVGCELAPRYDAPHLLLPDSYQGSGPFRQANPDAALSLQGDWWTLFGDPLLNQYEEQLRGANPTLQAAAETYTQARDLAAVAQSGLYPQLGISASVSENKQSLHSLYRNGPGGLNEEASNTVAAAASWEPDFWGATRNRAHEQKRLAQAGAADLAAAQLSLEAQLASNYIALRGLDAELELLRQSIITYQQAVEVTRLRTEGAIASGLDLARALSQLRSAQAQETDTQLQRDQLQHSIAVLVGANPSSFSIPSVIELTLPTPTIPLGIPSQLLERRPDISSAERQMAAANASIGVSRAAFYPNVTIGLMGGFQDSGFNLLSLPNDLWTLGAGAALPLFEGGLRRAELQSSWSQYAQTRDNYRATVLAAFQEVEDGLSQTQRLSAETVQQREASDQADLALSISTKLYQEGLDNFLSVSVAQVQALAARTVEIQIRTRQIQASVALIRALGGGWRASDLPSEQQTLPFGPLDYRVSPAKVP
jgi:outer membrane protein, multidrug efflux system